jgi:outer membrane translocation and assembly module TamA
MRPVNLPFGLNYEVGLHLAAFVDVGQAWNDADQARWKDGIKGYGAGVRLVTPLLNMLRVDVGFGQGGGIVRVHVGSNEKPEMQRQRVR